MHRMHNNIHFMHDELRATNEVNAASSEGKKSLDYFEGVMHQALASIDDSVFLMSEQDLEDKFKPTDNDFMIRDRIHSLLKEARATGQDKVATVRIFEGILTRQSFYSATIKNQYRLAWMMIPLSGGEELMKIGFYKTAKIFLDKILTMEVTPKTAPVFLKALEFFTNRHLGPLVQKMDINQKSMNMNLTSRVVSDIDGNIDPEKLLEKYREAKAKLVSAPKPEQDLDAE